MKLLACMNLGLKSCFHTSSTTANRDLLLHTVLHPHLFQPDGRWPAWTVNSDLHLYVISSACLASISVSHQISVTLVFSPLYKPCSTLSASQTNISLCFKYFSVFWPLLLPAACKAHKLHGFCILYCFLAFTCSFAAWFVLWTFILRSVRSSTFESASCSSCVTLSSVVPYTHLTHVLYLYSLSPDLVHLPSPNAAVSPAHVSTTSSYTNPSWDHFDLFPLMMPTVVPAAHLCGSPSVSRLVLHPSRSSNLHSAFF